jgi:3-deoxy-D-manno-octulosonic-acid transferase
MPGLIFWRTLYRVLLAVAWPWVHVRLRWRSRREPEYGKRIAERFGRVPEDVPEGVVWFHTVSAGETIAAAPLIGTLTEEFPDLEFLVTTMTPTGSAQVAERLGGRVAHCYAPYDFPAATKHFFDRVQPKLLILMETELWPNMLARAATCHVPALLVNARLSQRSARGYARLGALTRSMLESLRFLACQYPDHAERFLELGARADRIGVLGSVKFDVALPEDHARRVAGFEKAWMIASRPVWIAGSTHPGEEKIVLKAHKSIRQRFPDALLILAPRHPARREEVGAEIETAGFDMTRMSDGTDYDGRAVVLADTMGELLYLYGLSQVAFLGGSLASVGGHNPIEAAVCGQPLIMGPETFNFGDANALAEVVTGYFENPTRRRRDGARAAEVVAANTGATERLLELLRAEIRAAPGNGAGNRNSGSGAGLQ